MVHTVKDNAHAVLLPAFDDTQLSDTVKRFLANGGCSVLIGETREEYVARQMSLKRRQEETAETIIALTDEARSIAGKSIAAADQEIGGICRLHDLVPPFPADETISSMGTKEFEAICAGIAKAAKALGINCFLGPILDIVTGDNPWLRGRTWSSDSLVVAEKSSAYIRAIQSHGIAATAKHFPGYGVIERDPAVDPDARNREPQHSFQNSLVPFIDAIDNGVEIVMTGPAVVESFDPVKPASLSSAIISVLRDDLGFEGVVMSDDLDTKAISRGQPVSKAAVEALKAGSDYLLLADIDDHINQVVSAIVAAVESGDLAEDRLENAATKIRYLAAKYSS